MLRFQYRLLHQYYKSLIITGGGVANNIYANEKLLVTLTCFDSIPHRHNLELCFEDCTIQSHYL